MAYYYKYHYQTIPYIDFLNVPIKNKKEYLNPLFSYKNDIGSFNATFNGH